MEQNNGIGYNGKLPWFNKKELQLFKQRTMNSTLVIGRKTAQTIPVLKDRNIVCMTKNLSIIDDFYFENPYITFVDSFENIESSNDIYIAGGAEIYKQALEKPGYVTKIYMTITNSSYDCDTFFDNKWIENYVVTNKECYTDDGFDILTLEPCENGERQYLNTVQNILTHGELRDSRNGVTISTFINNMKFDLRDGFPLLTTKKMFLRGIIEELLFFLRGDTDSTILSDKNIHIWEGNTTIDFIKSRGLNYAKGVMGPMYGYLWRHFGAKYKVNEKGKPLDTNEGIDQLAIVIDLIKNDPHSRRIMMTTYNPTQAEEGVLYPCHSIVSQFYVSGEYLDMYCYCRSQDFFLGTPYNISSSSILLMLIAKLTNKIPRYYHHSMGDTHIYSDHIDCVREQIKRLPFKFPTLEIPDIKNIEDIKYFVASDFKLINYHSHPSIKAEMIA